jgi:glucose-6-phosphate isomerase
LVDEQNSVTEALERLVCTSFASSLWSRNSNLWPEPSIGAEPPEKSLGWLDLPFKLSGLAGQFESLNDQIVADGFSDIVLLGMGGSSMASRALNELFSSSLEAEPPRVGFHVLDTVIPTTIKEITRKLNPGKTLFFISSKSGSTIETLSLESYFRSLRNPDAKHPVSRRNFIALSDPGTPLSERARAGEFGTWVSTPEDVGGRFSALSAFGMVPAAAAGLNIRKFAESSALMAQRCQSDSKDNPGLALGAFLAGNALQGRDKVTLITSKKYSGFSMWVEQLLAESTGKNGEGLVPIVNEPVLDPANYGSDRQFIVFDTAEKESKHKGLVTRLNSAGHPVFVIKPFTTDIHEIAGEFFRWQFATTVASALIGIYPFDQPDVESSKIKARRFLYENRSDIKTSNLVQGLHAIGSITPPQYVALTAFMPESDALTEAFMKLRSAISEKTGAATTFSYGPRYLHSMGQLYKGGPNNYSVLCFISGKHDDLPVPNATYTFEQLTRALAEGDFEAMAQYGQNVNQFRFGPNAVEELQYGIQENFG